MKEFIGFEGGRTLFNEDMEALKELALSFSHFFEDAGFNFIISGCDCTLYPTGKLKISEGYVWLDGKIRKFTGASLNHAPDQFYLIPSDKNGQSINYYTKGVSGFMSTNYEVIVSAIAPTSAAYIKYTRLRAPNLNTFFTHYGLSKTTFQMQEGGQYLNKPAKFNKDVAVEVLKVVSKHGESATISLDTSFNIVISLYDPYDTLCKEYRFDNGIESINLNGVTVSKLAYQASPLGTQYLPTVITRDAIVNKLTTSNIYIGDKIVNNLEFDNIDISDWIPMLYDGNILDNLYVKNVFNHVYISGVFPQIDDKNITSTENGFAENHCSEYKTNIFLPTMIQLPKERTYFPVRCKDYANKNTSIICYFKDDRYLYFRSNVIKILPSETVINWHYQY